MVSCAVAVIEKEAIEKDAQIVAGVMYLYEGCINTPTRNVCPMSRLAASQTTHEMHFRESAMSAI